jgi:hypothetical protein
MSSELSEDKTESAMGEADSQPLATDSDHTLPTTKRAASDEPNAASDPKRIKLAHDGLSEAAVQPPPTRPAPWRVPFPEKVGMRIHFDIARPF